MTLRRLAHHAIVLSVVFLTTPALAEYQCAPPNISIQPPTVDPLLTSEVSAWSEVTRHRPLEGDASVPCADVTVPGYEGFPTKRCEYSDADAGNSILHAEVIILNPSASQLAAWSIDACRVNGASARTMAKCLKHLRGSIIQNDGAQFPVVGSVVESFCNSGSHEPCEDLKKTSEWRRARHTWFRDGVAVWYKKSPGPSWVDTPYDKTTFNAVFNVSQSDLNITSTRDVARIGGALRDNWKTWRRHIGKSELPDGQAGTVDGHGWRVVTSAVQKAACKGQSNELFEALVFAHPTWTQP